MSSVAECENCGSDVQFNPKEYLKYHGRRSTSFGRRIDPIQEEIKDLEDRLLTYEEVPVIPFLDGYDANLHFFNAAYTYSPTHQAVIDNICEYAFGGEFTIIQKQDLGVSFADEKEVKLTRAQAQPMIDFIKGLNPEMGFLHLFEESKKHYTNYQVLGNAAFKISEITVADERRYWIENVDFEQCRYKKPLFIGDPIKIMAISPSWEWFYVTKYPPKEIAVWPDITDEGDGVRSTIVHIKNDEPGRDWYGLPPAKSALWWMFLEMQMGEYGTKGYANEWTAKFIAEFTADDSELDEPQIQQFFSDLEHTFTQGGDAKQFMATLRKPGDEPMKVHEFQERKSHEFHDKMHVIAEKQISKAHKWPLRLLDDTLGSKMSSSGQEFKEIFKQTYYTVIRPWQKKIRNSLNKCLEIIGEMSQNSIPSEFSLDYVNIFADFLALEKEAENNDNSQSATADKV